eukprot:scaffold11690_cov108-Isochrysis_galbana.AAC.7
MSVDKQPSGHSPSPPNLKRNRNKYKSPLVVALSPESLHYSLLSLSLSIETLNFNSQFSILGRNGSPYPYTARPTTAAADGRARGADAGRRAAASAARRAHAPHAHNTQGRAATVHTPPHARATHANMAEHTKMMSSRKQSQSGAQGGAIDPRGCLLSVLALGFEVRGNDSSEARDEKA